LNYWPFWLSGLALAAVAVLHWVLIGRMLAVSGRMTQLVNRLRFGREEPGLEGMTAAELAEALQQATAAEFGQAALEALPAEAPPGDAPPAEATHTPAPVDLRTSPPPVAAHLLFFGGLAAGGLLSSWWAGGGPLTATLRGETFARLVGGSPVVSAVLLLGSGVLIGFGTRMAGGCTSGHGLCGVSRFQPGSILATASFFGVGIILSLVIGRFL
jgi:hypothetical protein